jgi:hypothetical protein
MSQLRDQSLVNESSHSTYVRAILLVLASLGIFIIALGFYLTGPRLAEFTTQHLSNDKVLDQATIALLYSVQTKLIALGVLIVFASILLGFLGRFAMPFIERPETISEKLKDYFEIIIRSLGKATDQVFGFATKEKCVWTFVILALLTLSIPGFFLSTAGGFHVEGLDLQPAKNLVKHGIYGTLTARGFDEFTHRSSAGPGVILLYALVFKLFGINVYYVRAMALIFVVATPFVFYKAARMTYGKGVAILAVALFAPKVMPFLGGDTGTASDGYIPGLFYFLVGTLFWFKSVEEKRNSLLILSGLFWALSFHSKSLFLFAIIALIMTFVLLRITGRQIGHRYYLFPILVVALVTLGWMAFRVFSLGLRYELVHLMEFWGEHGHRAFQIGNMLQQFALLTDVGRWGETELVLILVGLTYWAIRIFRGKMADYRELFLGIFMLIWSAWWLLFNYDLPDLHFKIPLLIAHFFIAKLLYDFWKMTSSQSETFLRVLRSEGSLSSTAAYLFRMTVVVIILQNVFTPLSARAQTIYHRYDTLTKPSQEMMTYIEENLEKNAVFSGWAWSIPWFMTMKEEDQIIKDRATYPPEQREPVAEYFIVSPEWPLVRVTDEWPSKVGDEGSAGKLNERRKQFVATQCTLVKVFGGPTFQWFIYKVKDNRLGARLDSHGGA